jgi:hypothetical protein
MAMRIRFGEADLRALPRAGTSCVVTDAWNTDAWNTD